MTIPMLLQWSFTAAALCISTYALVVARRTSDRSLIRRLQELSTLHSELTETVEKLTLRLRNLGARMNMQAYREKKANGEIPSAQDGATTDPEVEKDRWTREMNLKIATGQVRLPGRR